MNRSGKINIGNNLFLGLQEYNQFQNFFENKHIQSILNISKTFGIIGNCFKIEAGGILGTLSLIQKSIAVDKNGKFITQQAFSNLVLPAQNIWYKIKISYKEDPTEVGLVSIDNQGNLTGLNTKFTEILRNSSNGLSSVIKFTNSIANQFEYEVADITDDTHAILAGSFSSEVNLTFKVVGTFCPETIPQTPDKDPFQYDSCNLQLIDEASIPVLISDIEFFIARVKFDGSILLIEDLRDQFWAVNTEQIIITQDNPLIGINSVKWGNLYSTKEKNQVSISWSFNVDASNWTISAGTRQISILSGEGGIYKNIAAFADGDFNGWRVYKKDGKYDIINSSIKSGSAIILNLDKLVGYNLLDNLILTPDVEGIEIQISPDSNDYIENLKGIIYSDINVPFLNFDLLVPNTYSYKYQFNYRYKSLNKYSEWKNFPSALISGLSGNGYYAESSFDENGILKAASIDRTRKTYNTNTNFGFIELITNPDSYKLVIDKLSTGDLFGVEHRALNNNNPVIDFIVGLKKRSQIIEGGISFTTDHFLNLISVGAKDGNVFNFIIDSSIVLGAYQLRVVQDYVNSGNIGTVLFTVTPFLITMATSKNLMLQCQFDGANWIVKKIVSYDESFDSASLKKANNLSDLLDKVASRTNLSVMSSTEVTAAINLAVTNLINGSPTALDTLKELADALGDNPNFATTIATSLGNKVDKITGKGLSTNDFTTALLNKLNNTVDTSDVRLSNARPASDVYSWAKEASKPAYSVGEISNAVSTYDGRLSDARVASDVYSWAKQVSKPSYGYSEVGISYYYATFGNFTLNAILIGPFKVITISFSGDTGSGVNTEAIPGGYAPTEAIVNALTNENDSSKLLVLHSNGYAYLVGTPSTTVYASATFVRLS